MKEFKHLVDRFHAPRRIDFSHILAQLIKTLLCFFLPNNLVRRSHVEDVEPTYFFAYTSHAMS
jgi:hypothetical protein